MVSRGSVSSCWCDDFEESQSGRLPADTININIFSAFLLEVIKSCSADPLLWQSLTRLETGLLMIGAWDQCLRQKLLLSFSFPLVRLVLDVDVHH